MNEFTKMIFQGNLTEKFEYICVLKINVYIVSAYFEKNESETKLG
jgi:hypothetical protein